MGIQSPDDKTILFTPGVQKTFSYGLVNADRIGVSISGDLSQYATIVDSSPNSGPRNIQVLVRLPQELNPGTYVMYLTAQQIAETKGMVGGLAAIRSPIKIISLYPGTYPQFSLSVPPVNVGDSIIFNVGVTNYGTETINSMYADVELFDPENKSIAIVRTNTASLESYKSENLVGTLNSKDYNLRPGIYSATAKLTYDGVLHSSVPEAEFAIGSLSVYVIGSTPEVIFNSTNKYAINVESDWVGDIDNIYARITMPNGAILKTPNIDLIKPSQNIAKAQGTLETYWETNGLDFGEYDVKIDLYYKGKISTHNAKVKVIDGSPPVIEKPKGFQLFSIENKDGKTNVIFMNMSMPLMLFLMVILVIGVIINVAVIFAKKSPDDKEKSAENKSAENASKSTSNSKDMQPPKL